MARGVKGSGTPTSAPYTVQLWVNCSECGRQRRLNDDNLVVEHRFYWPGQGLYAPEAGMYPCPGSLLSGIEGTACEERLYAPAAPAAVPFSGCAS